MSTTYPAFGEGRTPHLRELFLPHNPVSGNRDQGKTKCQRLIIPDKPDLDTSLLSDHSSFHVLSSKAPRDDP